MAWYFDELDDKLKKIADELPRIFEGMQGSAATTVKGSHLKRLDNGTHLTKYKSAAYQKMRSDLYGQTNLYINLQRSGTYIDAHKVGTDGDDIVYGIVTKKEPKAKNYGKRKPTKPPKNKVVTTSEVYGYLKEKHPDLVGINREDANKGIEAAKSYFNKQIKDLFAQFK